MMPTDEEWNGLVKRVAELEAEVKKLRKELRKEITEGLTFVMNQPDPRSILY